MSKVAQLLVKSGVRVMGANERKDVEEKLKRINDDLDPNSKSEETDSRPNLLQNKAAILLEKRKLEEMLNKDDDIRAHSGGDRDRLYAREKEIRAILKKDRLSVREVSLKPGSSDFESAVRKQMYNETHNGKLILEWQQIKRRLEPENPLADDVGLLDR